MKRQTGSKRQLNSSRSTSIDMVSLEKAKAMNVINFIQLINWGVMTWLLLQCQEKASVFSALMSASEALINAVDGFVEQSLTMASRAAQN